MSATATRSRPPLLAAHLHELRFVGQGALSPDGRRGVYVLSEVVAGEDDAPPRYRHRLRLLDLDDGDDRPLTQGEGDRAPAWSPSGETIAFLAPARSEAKQPGASAQLHVIDVTGGEARPLTTFAAGVIDHLWHPNGRDVLVTTRGAWRDEAARSGRGRVITVRQHRRDGVVWAPTGPVELWRVRPDGRTRRLWRFPTEPTGVTLTPDGQHVVYVAAADADEADGGNARLWSRPLVGGEARDLLGRPGHMSDPSVSPDGRSVAFLESQDPDDEATPSAVWLVDATGGPARVLTRDVAAAPSVAGDSRLGAHDATPRWEGPDRLVVITNREGRSSVARVDVDGSLTEGAREDRVVTSFDARGGRVLCTVETPLRTAQLHVIDADGAERALTSWNDDLLAGHRSAAGFTTHTFEAGDGQPLTSWRLEPVRPRRDRAIALQVHGGPRTNYGYGFVFEFHVLAAAGFTVVYGNPRGGSSFGAGFAKAILGRYGTVDADDVLAIADHALTVHAAPDAPVHLTGGSYGGFMTNWLVGHTDRFRSAVTQRSICNWLSFYGTSDIGPPFTEYELGGQPWTDVEHLWDRSPLKYVANVTTPTLVIHSEHDFRCPIEQAEQWFTALKRLARAPTELVRFPDECHELSRSGRPDRRVQRLEAILGWFERHA